MAKRIGQRNLGQRLALGLTLAALLTLGSALALADQTYSMESIKPPTSAHVSQTIADAIQSSGTRVIGDSDGAKTTICEIFWARSIYRQDRPPDARQLLYANLKPGTFMGVVHFLVTERYVREYRSQMIKPGYYTMRYAALPESTNGNELDLVLLSSLSVDRNPSQVPPIDELVRRSRLVSRTKRPMMMSLVEVDTDQKFPSLITDDEGTCVLQVQLPVAVSKSKVSGTPQKMPIALIVVTSIPEDLGD